MTLSCEDYRDITDLIHRYALAASDCDPDAWAALFHEEAVWERKQAAAGTRYDQTVRISGSRDLRQFAADNLKPEAREIYMVTNCVVEGSGDEARARSTVLVYTLTTTPPSVFLVVNFEDSFARTPQGWRFTYRGVSLLNG
ncbi:nuclear transport factor 2 family protein [Pseudochelatococcus sp. B33]